MNYKVVIMMAKKNMDLLELVAAYIRRNLLCKAIVVIGKNDLREKCEEYGCEFIDEDKLYDTLSYANVQRMLLNRDVFAKSYTGWYFQQFLKMAYSTVCEDEYYLVWDADLIPLKKLGFFDEDGRPFFDVKTEYLPSYFCTLSKLFDGRIKKHNDYSYISEHMIIKTEYMRGLILELENNSKLSGNLFYERIINTIRMIDIPSNGFSEYETYGNYVAQKHPESYSIRRLKTLREGDIFLGEYRDDIFLEWAANSYDTICFENKIEQISALKDNLEYYMSNYSLEEVVKEFSEYIIYT